MVRNCQATCATIAQHEQSVPPALCGCVAGGNNKARTRSPAPSKSWCGTTATRINPPGKRRKLTLKNQLTFIACAAAALAFQVPRTLPIANLRSARISMCFCSVVSIAARRTRVLTVSSRCVGGDTGSFTGAVGLAAGRRRLFHALEIIRSTVSPRPDW